MIMRAVRQQDGEAGSALIELGISALVFLTVLFGIIDVGRALYSYDWVSNAARLGTRFMMVRGTNCTRLPGGCPALQSDLQNYILGPSVQTGVIIANNVAVHVKCQVTGNIATPPPCSPGGYVWVQVQYQFQFLSPLLPRRTWTMSSASQRVVQN
jgi:TadE-like protein